MDCKPRGQHRKGTRTHARREPCGGAQEGSEPSPLKWPEDGAGAMQAFPTQEQKARTVAAAQAAAKLLHTRRKKSKRSRVGCRSVFSSPGP